MRVCVCVVIFMTHVQNMSLSLRLCWQHADDSSRFYTLILFPCKLHPTHTHKPMPFDLKTACLCVSNVKLKHRTKYNIKGRWRTVQNVTQDHSCSSLLAPSQRDYSFKLKIYRLNTTSGHSLFEPSSHTVIRGIFIGFWFCLFLLFVILTNKQGQQINSGESAKSALSP